MTSPPSTTGSPDPVAVPAPRTHPYVALAILTSAVVLNAVDRQLISVLAEPIKQELGLSDSQLGLLSGFVFAVFYTFFGIPIAWLSDRSHRVRLIAISCALWSAFSAACGLAGSFVHLALLRMGVAVGEAGGSPPSYSLISDYFPPEKRGTALAVFSVGVPIGMAVATAFGATVAVHYGWRMAFFAASAPAVIVCLLLVTLVDEPRRGRLDATTSQTGSVAPPLWSTLGMIVRDPVLLSVIVAAALSVFASHGVMSWMPAFLVRTKGMAMGEIALYYSLVSGLGMVAGSLVAGRLADHLLKRGRRFVPLIPAAANMLAWPFLIAAVWSPTWQLSLACLLVPMICFWMYLPVALLLIQNSVPANQRATSGAVLLFVVGIVGIGGGATFIGVVSDLAVGAFGLGSLKIAFMALIPAFWIAVGGHLFASRQIRRRDEAAS